jgi:GT2 family glycosyltransferase
LLSLTPTASVPHPPGPGAARRDSAPVEAPPGAARVAALIVTWNRREAVDVVLRALARQGYPLACLDVVVVDNGSTDHTVEWLSERWRPDAVFDNPTPEAHRPDFRRRDGRGPSAGPPNAGFASLSIIANTANHGGCGGFNTALAFAERYLDSPASPLDYAWLVDDDVDLPDNALSQLTATATANPRAGLIGSRTVDFDNRRTTIETTIYFDYDNGWMGPDPTPTHRLAASHRDWVAQTGGTRGDLQFSGVREVDVVSACSLLARWSAVKDVGFWDHRYFIYCDDADWCLRFAKRGHAVLLDLDAVVYHTYWLSKLTPTRGYYSQRNLVWLIQKVFSGRKLRASTLRRLVALLIESRKAMTHCRLFHADIIRRTADDIITGRGGKLENAEPPFLPLMEALDRAGALRQDARVLVMCSHPASLDWYEQMRRELHYALMDAGRLHDTPDFHCMTRDLVQHTLACGPLGDIDPPAITRFEANRRSKWRAQKPLLRSPADATIVFNQHNDLPLVRNRATIHIDTRRPGLAQHETDTWRDRIGFLRRWVRTALRCLVYAARVRPYVSSTKYG